MNFKLLICAIFDHQFGENGKKTCMKHKVDFGRFKICGRCGLQENIGNRVCEPCMDEFIRKVNNG